ncbi:hypothetical protein FGB62_48g14 [Gracilaria domingensis]|nr:hypothetical protein FGB62_48g14 [Gracilaria domingensis]
MTPFPACQAAFTQTAPASGSRLRVAPRCGRRARPRVAVMTLHPQDLSWREERDRHAVESEFISIRHDGKVDADMAMLRERMQLLGQKEKQWADICHQFLSLSMLTGVALVDRDTGEPTLRAWILFSLSAAVPLYVVALLIHWLHTTSVSFGSALPL